jgi:hypothetical protein
VIRLVPDDDRRYEEREDRRTAPSLMPKAVRRAIAAHVSAEVPMALHRNGRIFWCGVDWLLEAVRIS